MSRAEPFRAPFNRSIVRRLAIFVALATAIIGLTSIAPPSRATAAVEATGYYGFDYSGTSPTITNTRIF
jgi:hypothetical protein